MNILFLLFFLIPFATGDEIFDQDDLDSLEEAQNGFSNFGSRTNVRKLPKDTSIEDQNDSRDISEKHKSVSSVFFNLGSSQRGSLIRSSENDDSRELNIIESPKLIDQTLKEFSMISAQPAFSGRIISAELREDQNSNEVSFEVTEVSVASQISEVKDESTEVSSVLNNGSLLITTSREEFDKESTELIENQSTEDKNSIETQEFIVRNVENGNNFQDFLKNSREFDSLQTSDEDSTEASLGLIRNVPVDTQKSDSKPRRFFVRPLDHGKNFSAELNVNKHPHQNAVPSSEEDSLEVTAFMRRKTNDGAKISKRPEFFIRPIDNARHFSSEQKEKKNNNLFQISIEDDSLEVVSRFNGGQRSETISAVKSHEFIVKPKENGSLLSTKLNNNRKSTPEASVSTPANFITSFQQKPTPVQNPRDFKKSYPQKSLTKFGQTQENFQISAYPSPKICLDGEVIGLDGRCTFPEIIKNIYIYQKPIREYVSAEFLNPPKPKVKINLVVIRSDGSDNRGDPIIIPPPQEKTVVLVLDKEDENGRKIIEVTPPPSGEPEVYFVDYKDGENPLLPGGIDLQEALGSAILHHPAYESPKSSSDRQQQYQVPQQQYQYPQQQYQDPQQQYLVPQQQYLAPQQQYQAPQQLYEAPQTRKQSPTIKYEAPQLQYKLPQERAQLEPQTQPTKSVSNLFLETDPSSSSKEDDSSESNSRILLPSPTRLLNLKQNNENARRSRATGGRSFAGWGRMRNGDSKRLKSILPTRSSI